LLTDYSRNRANALRLIETNGADFINIPNNVGELGTLNTMIWSGFVPTSIIIDGEGNMIGQQMVGTPRQGYAHFIELALEFVRELND
jgi:hypothetical protein